VSELTAIKPIQHPYSQSNTGALRGVCKKNNDESLDRPTA
jgi:hypothetical protein